MNAEPKRRERIPAGELTLTVLMLSDDPELVFMGQLDSISQDGLSFSYIANQQTLENHIGVECRVRLKRLISSEQMTDPIPCRVIFDSYAPPKPYSFLPLRYCELAFKQSLPLSTIRLYMRQNA